MKLTPFQQTQWVNWIQNMLNYHSYKGMANHSLLKAYLTLALRKEDPNAIARIYNNRLQVQVHGCWFITSLPKATK